MVGRPCSVIEIVDIHGLPASTAYRLILGLERAGLVVAEKVGRERVARPTLKGRLVARIEANASDLR